MTSAAAQPFRSILFPAGPPAAGSPEEEPACFSDLNLDQVIDAITAGRGQYDLKPLFYAPLTDRADAQFRHDVLRDLERPEIRACTDAFAREMSQMRDQLTMSERLRYPRQQDRLFLDAVLAYGDAVTVLAEDLSRAGPQSAGLRALRDYLGSYGRSSQFLAVYDRAEQISGSLSDISYCLHVKGDSIRVTRYDGEPDYTAEVRSIFRRFAHHSARSPAAAPVRILEMDHIEAGILDLVACLYPAEFQELASFRQEHRDFRDPALIRFDREVQFYLSYLDYLAPLREAGLRFCYPRLSVPGTGSYAADAFDLALASKLAGGQEQVVRNDFRLAASQRLMVVTGPNQGGKTTFARAIGQVHYLASLGCLVPARDALVPFPARVLAHFEREEDLSNLSGKLQEDLNRMHQILQEAATDTIIILNEIFTSTTPSDAVNLSTAILEQIAATGATCVCVTFLDELAAVSPDTVSMVATVVPGSPAVRTFRILPRPADGLAYAEAIAQKYGLTYDKVKARVAS